MIEISLINPNLFPIIDIDSIAKTAFTNTGKRLVRLTKEDMEAPKSGKTYVYMGRSVTASAPGEAPAVRSGNLLKSVRFKIEGSDMEFGAGNNTIDYAKFLELGTRKIEARPVYEKIVKQEYGNILKDFGSALGDQL